MSFALNQLEASVRYSLFGLANLLLLLWTYKIVARAKQGWTRFFWSTPLFVLCYLIFTLFDFDNPSERAMSLHVVLNYLWLCPWKLLAFSMNRGCLKKALESRSLGVFTVSLLLNVNVAFEVKPLAAKKKDDDAAARSNGVVHAHDDVEFSIITYKGKALLYEVLFALCKVCGKVLIIFASGYVYAVSEPRSFLGSVACMWGTYGLGGFIQEVSLFITLLVVNIKLENSFDQPYLSTSFSDFWAKRWNRVMASQLRDLCYEPIVEGQWIAPREYLAKREKPFVRSFIGIALTFVGSALIHWVILSGSCPVHHVPLRYMSIFVLNAFVVGFEVAFKMQVRKSNSLKIFARSTPTVLRMFFVHVSLLVMAHFLFLPDMHDCGFVEKAFEPTVDILRNLSIL